MYPLTVLRVTVGIKTGKVEEFDTSRATGVRGKVFGLHKGNKLLEVRRRD